MLPALPTESGTYCLKVVYHTSPIYNEIEGQAVIYDTDSPVGSQYIYLKKRITDIHVGDQIAVGKKTQVYTVTEVDPLYRRVAVTPGLTEVAYRDETISHYIPADIRYSYVKCDCN